MPDWDKRGNETARMYHYFCVYRDLGPERTVRATAKALGQTGASLERLAQDHDWVRRADAWDQYVRAAHDRAYLTEVSKNARKRGQLAAAMLMKVALAVQQWDAKRLKEAKVSEIVRLFDVAARAQRLEDGLATEHIAVEVMDARVILSRLPPHIQESVVRYLEAGEAPQLVLPQEVYHEELEEKGEPIEATYQGGDE